MSNKCLDDELFDIYMQDGKTIIESLRKIYSKGFMDGVNDTSERFKSSGFRAKHDSDLLDKVMQKWRTIIDEDGVMYKVVLLKDIEDLRKEVSNE